MILSGLKRNKTKDLKANKLKGKRKPKQVQKYSETRQDKKIEYFYGPYSKDYLWTLMTMNNEEGMKFDQNDFENNEKYLWTQLTNFITSSSDDMFGRIVTTLKKDK